MSNELELSLYNVGIFVSAFMYHHIIINAGVLLYSRPSRLIGNVIGHVRET